MYWKRAAACVAASASCPAEFRASASRCPGRTFRARSRYQITAALPCTQCVGHQEQIFGVVYTSARRAGDPVLLAAHDATLDLQHDTEPRAGPEKIDGHPEVVVKWEHRAVVQRLRRGHVHGRKRVAALGRRSSISAYSCPLASGIISPPGTAGRGPIPAGSVVAGERAPGRRLTRAWAARVRRSDARHAWCHRACRAQGAHG